jgi:D-alanyl-D-alanine carboxypeptidase
MRTPRTTALAALVTAFVSLIALALSGCAASAPETPSPATESPTAEATGTAQPCVADPARVAAFTWPDQAFAPLDADTSTVIRDAANAALIAANENGGVAPGALVAVRTPQGTFIQAVGSPDILAETPMDPSMHLRIGSITKTFTGSVLLQLVQEGALSLDDTLDNWHPEFPNSDEVTVRQLADMHSGLASYTTSEDFGRVLFTQRDKVWTTDELLSIAQDLPPSFDPGTDYEYSNTNTVLLGSIISQIEGKPYGDVLNERILQPLGLTGTSWPGDSPDIPAPFARGYTLQGVEGTTPYDATTDNPSWGNAAGEMISTIDDLLTWTSVLATGQGILDEQMAIERLSSFPGPYRFSYGLGVACFAGWVGHEGELPGYNATVYYNTDADIAIAVQVNSDIASGACPGREPIEGNLTHEGTPSAPCRNPAALITEQVTAALGHPWVPNP